MGLAPQARNPTPAGSGTYGANGANRNQSICNTIDLMGFVMPESPWDMAGSCQCIVQPILRARTRSDCRLGLAPQRLPGRQECRYCRSKYRPRNPTPAGSGNYGANGANRNQSICNTIDLMGFAMPEPPWDMAGSCQCIAQPILQARARGQIVGWV
ncbi:hypothetical protein GCM10011348_26430 [Marinobacterium nitratireducens]|uniref:Uncharacterized protein n=1 Tax=Marinobacterium nitratireducens TaxID=518897 RepID=A0A917ZHR3_9GAMM|nr:hypothetical protein GCM10011348_26430 [Marinobacterium nitratireducens]